MNEEEQEYCTASAWSKLRHRVFANNVKSRSQGVEQQGEGKELRVFPTETWRTLKSVNWRMHKNNQMYQLKLKKYALKSFFFFSI